MLDSWNDERTKEIYRLYFAVCFHLGHVKLTPMIVVVADVLWLSP